MSSNNISLCFTLFAAVHYVQRLDKYHELVKDYDADAAASLKIQLKDFKVKSPKGQALSFYRELHSQETSEVSVLGKAAVTLSKLDKSIYLRKFSELEHCLLPAVVNLEGQIQRLSQEFLEKTYFFCSPLVFFFGSCFF